MTTCHANGCADALRRLETMVLLAESGLPLAAVRDQLASAVDLVVQVVRASPREGTANRRIVEVAEVLAEPAPGRRLRPLVLDGEVVADPHRPRVVGAGSER